MIKKIFLVFLSFFFSFTLVEFILRAHFHFLDPIEQAKRTSVMNSPLFGWDLRPNHEYKIADSGFFKIDKNGFRYSPKEHDAKKKTVFLIGDSFTHASDIANEDVYYQKLDGLDINFYSYGVIGWSNYQELLKVKEHIKRLNPDIIIWQLSANDLIENVYDIEKRLGKKSFGRPYLDEKGSSFYDSDISFVSKLRVSFNKLRTVSFILGQLQSSLENSKDEIVLSKEETEKSILITKLIFNEMKSLIPSSSMVVAFNAGPLPFDEKILKKMATTSGFIYLEEIEDALNEAKAFGHPYFTQDAFHWNKQGHFFVSSLLTPKIKTLLDSK